MVGSWILLSQATIRILAITSAVRGSAAAKGRKRRTQLCWVTGTMQTEPPVVLARVVLNHLRKQKPTPTSFSCRDVFRRLQGRFSTIDDLLPVLELLERHELIRPTGEPHAPALVASRPPSQAVPRLPHQPEGGCRDCRPQVERCSVVL